MSETKTYQGGCHCGKVRFEATLGLDRVIECNCSICGRLGAVRTFTPAARFKLLSGAESLTDYQFGKERLHHQFCKVCGVHSFASGSRDGVELRSINLRCLDDFDLESVQITQFDGKKL